MGGSRRRLKKGKPVVKVGLGPLKRKKNEKTRVPLDVTEKRPHLEKRLQTRCVPCQEGRQTLTRFQL
jgi:hypothetical protein